MRGVIRARGRRDLGCLVVGVSALAALGSCEEGVQGSGGAPGRPPVIAAPRAVAPPEGAGPESRGRAETGSAEPATAAAPPPPAAPAAAGDEVGGPLPRRGDETDSSALVSAGGVGPYTIVLAGRLLDVQAGRYLTRQALLLDAESGQVRAVGPEERILAMAPPDARRLDLSGATVLPGLIDAHTHLTYAQNNATIEWLKVSYPREALYGARFARLTLLAGFTTVRNLGARGYSDVSLRDAIAAGDVLGPRMLCSGPPLGSTGGHMDNNHLPPQFGYREEGIADGVDAVRHKTREIIKYGADVIKIAVTGGVLSQGDDPGDAQYSDAELKAIVEEAHRLHKKVAAHAHGLEGLKQAIRAGVDSIEHGSNIDDEALSMMKAQGVFLVPTLYASEYMLKEARPPLYPADMIAKARAMLPGTRPHLERALRSGVKLAFGTDSSVYPHGQNAREFHQLVKLGLSPLQAIRGATVYAAELLGPPWTGHVGVLQPGSYADLIAVEGDPLTEVRVLEKVPLVMKAGVVVKDERGWTRAPAPGQVPPLPPLPPLQPGPAPAEMRPPGAPAVQPAPPAAPRPRPPRPPADARPAPASDGSWR